jgi:hypothetical protein
MKMLIGEIFQPVAAVFILQFPQLVWRELFKIDSLGFFTVSLFITAKEFFSM